MVPDTDMYVVPFDPSHILMTHDFGGAQVCARRTTPLRRPSAPMLCTNRPLSWAMESCSGNPHRYYFTLHTAVEDAGYIRQS